MITREKFAEMLQDGGTHRKQFSFSSGIQKRKQSPTFSVPFDSGLCCHFKAGTGLTLTYNSLHEQYYCFLRDDGAITLAEEWEAAQGARVFIRNLLSSTVALDVNFVSPEAGEKTEVGRLEEVAKHEKNAGAITELVGRAADVVNDIPYLRDCSIICAVPCNPEKKFDLPKRLAEDLAVLTGKLDMTPSVELVGKGKSAKEAAVGEKWDVWEEADIAFKTDQFVGKSVILLGSVDIQDSHLA